MTYVALGATLLLWAVAIGAVMWRWLTMPERPDPDAPFFTRREAAQALREERRALLARGGSVPLRLTR